jgi:hypothetical protein
MESKTLTLPIKQDDGYGYRLAFRLAREDLARIDDIEAQCRKSGAQHLAPEKAVVIRYLHQEYLISLTSGDVSLRGQDEEVLLLEKILLLHYFTQAKGTPAANELISFKELPEGAGYFPTFYQRAIKPLVTHFGGAPEQILEMARSLGGEKTDYGDISVSISALSRVPLTLVLWRGDDEFPPEGSIILDRTIPDYLPAEDIIYLCQMTSWRLVKLLKSHGDKPGHDRGKAGTDNQVRKR